MSGIGGNAAPGARLVLRLGVSDATGRVTSTGNRFIFQGALTTATGTNTPIVIDQALTLYSGFAMLEVPLSLPAIAGPATIIINQVAVLDDRGNAFAVPGIALAQQPPPVTPQPTPTGSCVSNNDCNDGDPATQDVCTPV